MRNLFIIIIIFALLGIVVLIQRRQLTQRATSWQGRRVRSLQMVLSHQYGQNNIRLIDKLKQIFSDKLFVVLNTLDFKNRPIFIRNMLIPSVGAVALIAVNMRFIGLPTLWVSPIAFLTVYMISFTVLRKRRYKAFNINFTEALTTVNGAISSGRTFLQAMSDYSAMNDSLLAKEFGNISRRLNVGENPEKVFNDSWRIYPYREYYFFIVAILLNIRGGGRLKEVLLKLQRSVATNVAMEKKMLSMTSEMRMSAKITGAIPFIFLLILKFMNPQDFDYVIYDEGGKTILYYLLGSVFTGSMIIKFLMRGI